MAGQKVDQRVAASWTAAKLQAVGSALERYSLCTWSWRMSAADESTTATISARWLGYGAFARALRDLLASWYRCRNSGRCPMGSITGRSFFAAATAVVASMSVAVRVLISDAAAQPLTGVVHQTETACGSGAVSTGKAVDQYAVALSESGVDEREKRVHEGCSHVSKGIVARRSRTEHNRRVVAGDDVVPVATELSDWRERV